MFSKLSYGSTPYPLEQSVHKVYPSRESCALHLTKDAALVCAYRKKESHRGLLPGLPTRQHTADSEMMEHAGAAIAR